jgi:hypothetical protein
MKTVFVSNGVVAGHAAAHQSGVTVSSTIPGAAAYDVDDSSPVDAGWTVTLDANGVPTFTAPAPPTTCVISAVDFYDCFTPSEAVAIKASTDPLVQEFVFRLLQRIDAGRSVDTSSPSIQEGVEYLATSVRLPATTPASTYIATSRVAEILRGTMQ